MARPDPHVPRAVRLPFPLPLPLQLQLPLALTLALTLAGAGRAQTPAPEPARPRLIALVAVDQLAAWVLEQTWPHLGDGGFRRIAREGVTFARCAYRHACTLTAPGHATLATGAPAAAHGIIGNSWFDRESGKSVYSCEDKDVTLLGGKASGSGRSPAKLLAPALGDAMKAHLGAASQVVSISWKDRAAILLGGRGADAAVWVEDSTGTFQSSTWYGTALPEWVAKINERRPFDACFKKVWDRVGPPEAYAGLVDEQPFEVPAPGGNRSLPRTMNGGKDEITVNFYAQLAASPFPNEILADAARAAIDAGGLGRDDVPDLLGLSLSANDIAGHNFGPGSVEARDLVLRTDRVLAAFLDHLDAAVGAGKWAVILSADHGIPPVPEPLAKQRLDAGRALLGRAAAMAANKALVSAYGEAPADPGRWIAGYDGLSLFLLRAELEKKSPDFDRACEIAAAAALTVRGIHAAVPASRLRAGRHPDDRVHRSLAAAAHATRAGDVLFAVAPYWLDSLSPSTHGTPWPYDQEVPLLAAGPGLARGVVSHVSVSPGLAAVLGARLCGIPPPSLAEDEVPGGVLTGR